MQLLLGDALRQLQPLATASVQTCVTSPPYYNLRDYGIDGQIGLEATPEAYTAKLVAVFREVHRVLRNDGTLWLNLGDTYASQGSSQNGGHKGLAAAEQCWDGRVRKPENDAHMNDSIRSVVRTLGGLKPKDLIAIPWRVALALQADGWYLRQDIIWHKPSPMPESVTDRCTRSHEYIFLLSKNTRYFFDNDAIREPTGKESTWAEYSSALGKTQFAHGDDRLVHGKVGSRTDFKALTHPLGRNKRSVWTVTTKPYKGAHFATFPPQLIEPCILAGAMGGQIVLDPFMGTGTTGYVARSLARNFIGIELNPAYMQLARRRLQLTVPVAEATE